MIILQTQKNDLFEIIRELVISPLCFTCTDYQYKRKRKFDEDKACTIISVKKQPILFFKITVNPDHYYLYYSPAEKQRLSHIGVYDWKQIIVNFKLWLQRVRREIFEPDKWRTLEAISQIFTFDKKNNTPFTQEEITKIEESVEELRVEIREKSNISSKQLSHLNKKIDYCIKELKASGRRDWYLLFINLILTEIISPEVFAKLWSPLGNWIYQFGLKLLAG